MNDMRTAVFLRAVQPQRLQPCVDSRLVIIHKPVSNQQHVCRFQVKRIRQCMIKFSRRFTKTNFSRHNAQRGSAGPALTKCKVD